RVDALLAVDRTETGMQVLADLLASPPRDDDKKMADRATAAVRLAALGRILNRPDLAQTGFSAARAVLALPAKSPQEGYWRSSALQSTLAEMRVQGRIVDAQALALDELQSSRGARGAAAGLGAVVVAPERRAALVELAGLYDSAGRFTDVSRLLDELSTWGARDVSAIIAEKDSLGVPIGLMAARAARTKGNIAAARSLLLALLDRLPGYDPAYQLLLEVDPPRAVEDLDRLYAGD